MALAGCAAGVGGEVGDAEQERGGLARGFGGADAERDGALRAVIGRETQNVAGFFEGLLGDVGDSGQVIRCGEPGAAGAGGLDGGEAFIDVVAGEPGGEGLDGGVVLGCDVGEGKGVFRRDCLENRVGGGGVGLEGEEGHGGRGRRTENREQRTENGEKKWSSDQVVEWSSGGVGKKGAEGGRAWRCGGVYPMGGVARVCARGRDGGGELGRVAERKWAGREGLRTGGEKLAESVRVRGDATGMCAEEHRCLRETTLVCGVVFSLPATTSVPSACQTATSAASTSIRHSSSSAAS